MGKYSYIKLFVCDIDGTLTDSTVFYTEEGEELKQFSHRDGRGFHLLREKTKIKTMWVTSEFGGINAARAKKLMGLGTLDYFADGSWDKGKIDKVKKVCEDLNISMEEVAFMGDDTNDLDLLKAVRIAACPRDAHPEVRAVGYMKISSFNGGRGAVRDFIDYLIGAGLCELR